MDRRTIAATRLLPGNPRGGGDPSDLGRTGTRLKLRPAVIETAAQGSSPDQYTMVSYHRPELDGLPEIGLAGRQLWSQSGLSPEGIQTADPL